MFKGKESKLSFIVEVKEDGSIVIPEEAREAFGINIGDEVALLGEKHKGLAIVKNDMLVKMIKSGNSL
ncbi:MAG: AbrB/MazE/SpoVT family DNA-binding domain-containing protein [Acutalibacteraceae bacterium]|nr:AbrB/MazE/SpoVT family DNA-binding domain-containing protein [Acutalibacteraceae bacterium]